MELLPGWSGANHTGIWEAGQKPQHNNGLRAGLANALAGFYSGVSCALDATECRSLPFVRVKMANLGSE